MKKITFFLALMVGAFAAQAQFDKIEVEEVESFDGYKTYRVYAVLKSQTDLVDAVYGSPKTPLRVESTAPFYQHPMGGALSKEVKRIQLDKEENLKFDSWVTIGYEDNYMNALAQLSATKDSVLVVRDFRTPFEEGNMLEIIDGAWFVTPDQLQARPDKDGRVLLMQLTTKGKITGLLNLHGRWYSTEADGSSTFHVWEEKGIKFSAG